MDPTTFQGLSIEEVALRFYAVGVLISAAFAGLNFAIKLFEIDRLWSLRRNLLQFGLDWNPVWSCYKTADQRPEWGIFFTLYLIIISFTLLVSLVTAVFSWFRVFSHLVAYYRAYEKRTYVMDHAMHRLHWALRNSSFKLEAEHTVKGEDKGNVMKYFNDLIRGRNKHLEDHFIRLFREAGFKAQDLPSHWAENRGLDENLIPVAKAKEARVS